MKKIFYGILFVTCFICFVSCGNRQVNKIVEQMQTDSTVVEQVDTITVICDSLTTDTL